MKIFNKLYIETLNHSNNVAILALKLGEALDLNENDLDLLLLGALFHDVGKTFIPAEILGKKERLNQKEMDTIRTHSQIGYDYMKAYSTLSQPSLDIIIEHHERLDGQGYPNRKIDNEINILSKIVAICDVYDALVSERAYKDVISSVKAVQIIKKGKNTQFDDNLVDIFTEKVIPQL